MESNTTREIADVLAGVPASVWDRAAEHAAEQRRRERESRQPREAENPWGIRAVPTRDSLKRITDRWFSKTSTATGSTFLTGSPNASRAIHRTRASLLAVRRSSGHPAAAQPIDPLKVLNREIDGYGVESITLRNGDTVTYVNLGDTYATTLLLIESGRRSWSWRYAIGSWGDLVEKHGGA